MMGGDVFDEIHHAFSFPNNGINENDKLGAADDGFQDEKLFRGLGEDHQRGKDG